MIREGVLIGKMVEVSPIAGGDLLTKRGKDAKIKGFVRRLGQIVGYEVELDGKLYYGSAKDFFVDRDVLEDIQPPTPTSVSLRETLSHWVGQRTYWETRIDGLEALCFDLASATPRALILPHAGGWKFLVPEPQPGCYTVVDCHAVVHKPYWSMTVLVYPTRLEGVAEAILIEDHWSRAFSWTHFIASSMVQLGFPWESSLQGLETRIQATQGILRPMVDALLSKVLQVQEKLFGEAPFYPPGSLSVGFSDVRLKAGSVGLVEPPTDRRAYTVMSVSPGAARDREYLTQVVLHECLHMGISSVGGDPHNEKFNQLAEATGLKKEHRD